ncbi:hypothetical protein FRC04_011211 [Tulasnella sp. 424]|nr:hypothetical protein FRC04_011211 [Tulasnella sp. 424]
MTWTNVDAKEPIMIYTKPGTAHVWSQALGIRTLALERQAVCAGSSSLVPATGICYDGNKDSVIISLSDSSLHAIYQASTNPALLPPPPSEPSVQSPISSINLSLTSRSFAAIVEKLESQRTLDAGDLAVTSGFTAFDEFGTMVWFAEQVVSMIRPQDLDYKPSAKRKSTLVVARLLDEDLNSDLLLSAVKTILNDPKSGQPPVATLRTVLLHLRSPSRFTAIRDRLLSMLLSGDMTEKGGDLMEMAPAPMTYATRLVAAFGATPKLQGAYLRFTLAHSCAMYHRSAEFEKAAQSILAEVARVKLEAVIKIWTKCSERVWSDADRLFARLVVTQALLLPTPPDSLRAAASSLVSELRLDLPEGADIVNNGGPQLLSSPTGLMKQASLGESCPACRAMFHHIPVDDNTDLTDVRCLLSESTGFHEAAGAPRAVEGSLDGV